MNQNPDPKQSLEALVIANRVKAQQSWTLNAIRALPTPLGKSAAAAIFRSPNGDGSIRAERLLRAVRSIGKKKSERMLHRAGVMPRKRVQAMTERQRNAIVEELVK